MTPAALSLLTSDPLAAAAERWLERLCSEELGPELWERALLAPARDFLRRPGKRFRGELVRSSWQLAGGAADACPLELELCLELLHAGSLIIDDIEDDSDQRRGAPSLHRQIGVPLALNTGNCLYFVPFVLLGRVAGGPQITAALYRRTSAALVDCHRGQALDLSAQVDQLAPAEVPRVVAATTRLKTGALMSLGAALPALAAGAPAARVEALEQFGRQLGVGLQMLDDLGSLGRERRSKGREDLRDARPTWPWAWLAVSADRALFLDLQARSRRAAGDGELDAVAEELRRRVEQRGRKDVRARLGAAVADLRRELGDSPTLALVEAQIQRLEASYG